MPSTTCVLVWEQIEDLENKFNLKSLFKIHLILQRDIINDFKITSIGNLKNIYDSTNIYPIFNQSRLVYVLTIKYIWSCPLRQSSDD